MNIFICEKLFRIYVNTKSKETQFFLEKLLPLYKPNFDIDLKKIRSRITTTLKATCDWKKRLMSEIGKNFNIVISWTGIIFVRLQIAS